MTTENKYRDRKFCAVLYSEDETHVAAIEKLNAGGYNFAAILHDADVHEDGEHAGELKKPHWLDCPSLCGQYKNGLCRNI